MHRNSNIKLGLCIYRHWHHSDYYYYYYYYHGLNSWTDAVKTNKTLYPSFMLICSVPYIDENVSVLPIQILLPPPFQRFKYFFTYDLLLSWLNSQVANGELHRADLLLYELLLRYWRESLQLFKPDERQWRSTQTVNCPCPRKRVLPLGNPFSIIFLLNIKSFSTLFIIVLYHLSLCYLKHGLVLCCLSPFTILINTAIRHCKSSDVDSRILLGHRSITLLIPPLRYGKPNPEMREKISYEENT